MAPRTRAALRDQSCTTTWGDQASGPHVDSNTAESVRWSYADGGEDPEVISATGGRVRGEHPRRHCGGLTMLGGAAIGIGVVVTCLRNTAVK